MVPILQQIEELGLLFDCGIAVPFTNEVYVLLSTKYMQNFPYFMLSAFNKVFGLLPIKIKYNFGYYSMKSAVCNLFVC